MAEYNINRGIDKPAEFKGLKSQYLFIFVIGLLSEFILFVILYIFGIPTWFCIIFGVVTASVLVWGVFSLNSKFGRYGLMKYFARKRHPRHIINRRKISNILKSDR